MSKESEAINDSLDSLYGVLMEGVHWEVRVDVAEAADDTAYAVLSAVSEELRDEVADSP